MSVLMRGMDMPKGGCWECPLRAGLSCNILPEYVYDYMDGHSMHPNCPLVEVPTPHGRLIDADSIQAHEMSVFGKRLMVIDESQTVIEAEE